MSVSQLKLQLEAAIASIPRSDYDTAKAAIAETLRSSRLPILSQALALFNAEVQIVDILDARHEFVDSLWFPESAGNGAIRKSVMAWFEERATLSTADHMREMLSLSENIDKADMRDALFCAYDNFWIAAYRRNCVDLLGLGITARRWLPDDLAGFFCNDPYANAVPA